MGRYAAFGYRIQSAIELPDLEPDDAPGAPDWRIQTEPSKERPSDGALLGTETVYGDVQVRAYASGPDFRLVFDDTGTFDVRPIDRVIAWYQGPEATEPAVRADLLGRVLAMAAHADGHMCLHASAVSIEGRAIALLGPKHAGKSTLALALVRHGARLMTDDTLVVRVGPDGSAWAASGVQRVRLWPDAARALDAVASGHAGAKPTVDRLTPEQLQRAQIPLAACYVLEATDGAAAEAVRRERMSAVHAAVACVRFSKLGSLAGGAVGRAVLERAGSLAREVPMFVGAVRRDLGSIDRVASALVSWHAPVRHARSVAVV